MRDSVNCHRSASIRASAAQEQKPTAYARTALHPRSQPDKVAAPIGVVHRRDLVAQAHAVSASRSARVRSAAHLRRGRAPLIPNLGVVAAAPQLRFDSDTLHASGRMPQRSLASTPCYATHRRHVHRRAQREINGEPGEHVGRVRGRVDGQVHVLIQLSVEIASKPVQQRAGRIRPALEAQRNVPAARRRVRSDTVQRPGSTRTGCCRCTRRGWGGRSGTPAARPPAAPRGAA